ALTSSPASRWSAKRRRGSPRTSARCGTSSTRSTTVSRKARRPTVAGGSRSSGPARQDVFHDSDERLGHAGPGLGARVRPGPPALPEERLDLRGRKGPLLLEVRLVDYAIRRYVARDRADRARPFVEGNQRAPPGQVGDREDALGPVVVGLLQQLPHGRR